MSTDRPDIVRASEPEAEWRHWPTWLQERLEWFQDLKFGLFIHWGPYSQWGCIESWPLVEDDVWARPDGLPAWEERGRDMERFKADYRALNRTFNPMAFAPETWADAARYAGMKYVCFTTKHHDGFCMFDTRTTEYRITHPDCPFHSHPRANITREVFDTFRARDFAVSCYFSKSDWNSPHYWWPGAPARTRNPNYDTAAHPERWERFVQFVHAQIRELMSGYGPVDALWLDGGQVRPPIQDIRMNEIAAMARGLQPGLIMVDRTVGGENENIRTPEQQIPDTPPEHPWESCLTMGNGWAFRANDEYKSARTLIHMLVDIVAKGGNFLLNIGPGPDGRFAPVAMSRLRELGDWMAINAPAIHGTRPLPPYQEGPVRFTTRAGRVYAIILPEADATSPPAIVRLTALQPAHGATVGMLGSDAPLLWRREGDRTSVVLPQNVLPCEHAWVIEFPEG